MHLKFTIYEIVQLMEAGGIKIIISLIPNWIIIHYIAVFRLWSLFNYYFKGIIEIIVVTQQFFEIYNNFYFLI